MHTFALCILTFVFILPRTSRADSSASYLVTESKGTVLQRSFLSYDWKTLSAGQMLSHSDTLMVMERSSVRLRSLSNNGLRNEITIARPFVSRIDDQMLREIKTTVYFDDKFAEKGSRKNVSLGFFTEAWTQTMALINHKVMSGHKGEDTVSQTLGLQASEIRLKSPWSDRVYEVDELPQSVRIAWHPIRQDGKKITYKISVWRAEEPIPEEPRDATEQDYYAMRFDSEGEYNLQIKAQGEKFQSKIIPFVIRLRKKNSAALSGKKESFARAELETLFPPDNWIVNSEKLETPIYWQVSAEDKSNNFQVEILPAVKNNRVFLSNIPGQAVAHIFPGIYTWRVKRANGDSSGWKRLSVEKGVDFRSLWSRSSSAVIELKIDP